MDLGDLGAFDGDAGHEALLVEEEHQDIVLGRGGRQRRAGALVDHHYVRRRADLPAVAVVEVAQRLLVHEVDRVAEGLEARLQTERSEEHTSELQSLMRISYAVFCWKKKKKQNNKTTIDKYDNDDTQ